MSALDEDLDCIDAILKALHHDHTAEQLDAAESELTLGPLPTGPVAPWTDIQVHEVGGCGVVLPPSVAAFLKRFGDPPFGPMGWHGITQQIGPHSGLPFPFPGGSRGYASLKGSDALGGPADAGAADAYASWSETSAGGVKIADLGCALYVWLILTGEHAGDVWISGGGAMGPFANAELLVVGDWMVPADPPRVHWRFEEWYRYWLEHADRAIREVIANPR